MEANKTHQQSQRQQQQQLQQHHHHQQQQQQQQHHQQSQQLQHQIQQSQQPHSEPLYEQDKSFATVASDAAAAVAKVSSSGLGNASSSNPSSSPKQLQTQPQHDPNVHPSLSAHDPSLIGETPADTTQPVGDAIDEDDDEEDDTTQTKPALSTPNAKERNSLTLDQRRALRRWANSQTPRPSHKTCIDWFLGQYGQNISQSTVSHSLSPKYQRLDAVPGDSHQLSGSRLRFGNWPDIERMVLMWYQQVQATGRNPTNEELGEKAKMIFMSLPRYRDEKPPEFSPGWIHRFKKRYGLLVRRHRRHGPASADDALNLGEDINYLAEHVPRFMNISAETSAPAIKESVMRVLGIESSVHTCALVRDEIVRRLAAGGQHQGDTSAGAVGDHDLLDPSSGGDPMYVDDDGGDHPAHSAPDQVTNPELLLHEHIRLIQQEHEEAEANAAAVRAERDRAATNDPQGGPGGVLSTPTPSRTAPGGPSGMQFASLALTPINASSPATSKEPPIRCPFCLNQRMLRTIKEAVEHMSTHVIV
jgi:hypothetical protein